MYAIRHTQYNMLALFTTNRDAAEVILTTQGIKLGATIISFAKAGYVIEKWDNNKVIDYVHTWHQEVSDRDDSQFIIATKAANRDLNQLHETGILQFGGVYQLPDFSPTTNSRSFYQPEAPVRLSDESSLS